MNSTIIKEDDGNVIYINNVGERFALAEAVTPIGPMRSKRTHDIIVCFKLKDHGDYEFADSDAPVKWFMGATFIDDYFDVNSSCHAMAVSDLLESCKYNLDVGER